MEILRFYADRYVALTRMLGEVRSGEYGNHRSNEVVEEDRLRNITHNLIPEVADLLNDVGLLLSVRYTKSMMERWRDGHPHTYGEINSTFAVLIERYEHELELQMLWLIEPAKRTYYEKATELFGPEVYEAFHSARLDIEEAGKSFAFSRNTACVLHLQRVLEVGLKSLATAIGGISVEDNRSWEAILHKIDLELAKKGEDRSPFARANITFCAESSAFLRMVKIAWRNPTMHVENNYDEGKALDVMNAAHGFMRHLATRLTDHGV